MEKFNNRTAAKLLCVIMAILCCIMPLSFNAFAANDTVKLTSDSKATITLNYPQAAAEKAKSVQISLQVTPHNAKVEFVPDSGIKIVESRYHSDTGILNIYLAGKEPLFPESGVFSLGSVKLSVSESGTATVGVVENSIKFVRSGKLDDSYLGSASIAVQQDTPAKPPVSSSTRPSNPPSSSATQPNNPASSTSQPSSPTSSAQQSAPAQTPVQQPPQDDDSDPDWQEPSGGNLDTSALSVALSRASNYKRGDYTESSFAVLTQAIDNANALISDPNATQDMIDEALLILENAIGMLTFANGDIPSSANNNPNANIGQNNSQSSSESSGGNSSESNNESTSESTDSNSTSNESSAETSGENSADSANSTDDQSSSDNSSAPQPSDSSQSSDAENTDGGENTFPIWGIVLIVVGVVIVAVVIIVFVKLRNKNIY